MKKIVIVLLIALVFTGSVFAEDFSTTLDIGHSFALLKEAFSLSLKQSITLIVALVLVLFSLLKLQYTTIIMVRP